MGFELLYKGSRDGFSGKQFHAKCDDKGATISIVKSDNKDHIGIRIIVVTLQNHGIRIMQTFAMMMRGCIHCEIPMALPRNLKLSKINRMQFMDTVVMVQHTETVMIYTLQAIAMQILLHTLIWETRMKEVNPRIN